MKDDLLLEFQKYKIRITSNKEAIKILSILRNLNCVTKWCPIHSDLIYLIGNEYFGETFDYKNKKYLNELPKEIQDRKLIMYNDFIKLINIKIWKSQLKLEVK